MTITSIRLDSTTRDRLTKHGKMHQSYDEVLNEILDKVEKKK